jgi:hypothetical protein
LFLAVATGFSHEMIGSPVPLRHKSFQNERRVKMMDQSEPTKSNISFFIANIEKKTVVFTSDAGQQEVIVSGSIGFQVTKVPRGRIKVSLIRLNLVTKGVRTKAGASGVLGLTLAKPAIATTYDPVKGNLEAVFDLILHYPLIDRKKGFREKRIPGDTCFVPYTEKMTATLSGSLPGLVPDEKGQIPFKLALKGEVRTYVLKAVLAFQLEWLVGLHVAFHVASVLPIQPVFIGTGPADLNATGWAFNELMQRARDMWDRCGKVHCLSFEVRAPVYLNNNNYRLVDDANEFSALSLAYSAVDAVEIFVAERLDQNLAVSYGGGGTYDSGTASARIVTCDQQLNVPCPAPCPGGGNCGDVNHYHLAHELGHVLNLDHPNGAYGLAASTAGSVMEGSGFCLDNPNIQSAKNCRNTSNPLLIFGLSSCSGNPDIMD